MQPSTRVIAISANASWNILNFRAGLVASLRAQGFRIVALTPADEAAARLADLSIEHHAVPLDRTGLSPLRDARLLASYLSVLRKVRPCAYLGWTIKPNVYGSIAAHLLGIPTINNVAGLGTAFIGRPMLQRIASLLYRAAFARSSTVFFQNADDRDLFVSTGLVDRGVARLLPGSGVDTARFTPGPLPDRGGAFRFLLIARLMRDKGVLEYVEAARTLRARHPHARFGLLGPVDVANRSAIGRADLDRWIAEGAITHLGEASDVRPHIADADCIVLPSYREGLPRTLLEGAAMARPVIATDVPGCRDVVEHGVNGFLCTVRDPASLAAAMDRLIALPHEERVAMGAAGRALVETRFDERFVIKRYLEAIAAARGGQR